jgi:hypothetical protein
VAPQEGGNPNERVIAELVGERAAKRNGVVEGENRSHDA